MNKEMSEKWKDKRIEINNNTWVVFDEDYVDFSQEAGKLDFVSLSKKEFENIIKEYNSYQEKNTRKKDGTFEDIPDGTHVSPNKKGNFI